MQSMQRGMFMFDFVQLTDHISCPLCYSPIRYDISLEGNMQR